MLQKRLRSDCFGIHIPLWRPSPLYLRYFRRLALFSFLIRRRKDFWAVEARRAGSKIPRFRAIAWLTGPKKLDPLANFDRRSAYYGSPAVRQGYWLDSKSVSNVSRHSLLTPYFSSADCAQTLWRVTIGPQVFGASVHSLISRSHVLSNFKFSRVRLRCPLFQNVKSFTTFFDRIYSS